MQNPKVNFKSESVTIVKQVPDSIDVNLTLEEYLLIYSLVGNICGRSDINHNLYNKLNLFLIKFDADLESDECYKTHTEFKYDFDEKLHKNAEILKELISKSV